METMLGWFMPWPLPDRDDMLTYFMSKDISGRVEHILTFDIKWRAHSEHMKKKWPQLSSLLFLNPTLYGRFSIVWATQNMTPSDITKLLILVDGRERIV